jgi:hypothetical protein
MLNYEVDRRILAPYLPVGTELDDWNGAVYASIVGFQFLRARFLGLAVPLHTNFVEVNLRFYVRRRAAEGWRRGVVFVRELAPRRAVAIVANLLYGERYVTVPMSHRIEYAEAPTAILLGATGILPVSSGYTAAFEPNPQAAAQPAFTSKPRLPAVPTGDTPVAHWSGDVPRRVEYAWRHRRRYGQVAVETNGPAQPLEPGTHEHYIAEHYWGYSALSRGRTKEYLVAHPPWRISPAASATFQCDAAAIYGQPLAECLSGPPASAFWADGSAVRVYRGRRVDPCPG